ncbi:cupredoxin domain-containing protein [Halomarina litorea]|uniref:cupredoxin domain-containing protein n=1 Tax=Halomarina litorea TaxID=2961595 RepID=UPI0020C2794E|nr:plastocyanin/azurin family copper-binding protein [Halomarina sp. BCD28]
MKRRTFLATAAGLSTVSLAGCIGSSLSASQYDVGMETNAFRPEQYTVEVGDAVVWGNSGSRPHTVTAFQDGLPEGASYFASGGYDSQQAADDAWPNGGGIQPGETYEHVFEVAGTYNYYCIPHLRGGMVGSITVEE